MGLSSGFSWVPRNPLTSSSRLGNILPRRKRSEKVGSTLTSPRRNVAFSSLGFEANVVASKKLSVEIASDEKKGCDGKEARLRRFDGCRVSSLGRRSEFQSPARRRDSPLSSALHLSHLDPFIQSRRTKLPSACSRKLCIDPRFINGGFPPHMYRIQHTSKRVQVVRRS